MNVVSWLAALFLASLAVVLLLMLGAVGRPLNAADFRRPWVFGRLDEVRLGALLVWAALTAVPSAPDHGLDVVLGEDPHRLVIDPDDSPEAGEEEAADEDPLTGPTRPDQEPAVLFQALGPVPTLDPSVLHSGVTGAFPRLTDEVLAVMAGQRAVELQKAA